MKPKMQLSPGNYVSDAYRAEINKWMIDFFGYEDDAPTIAPVVYHDAEIKGSPPVVKAPKKTPRRNKSKTQVQPDIETFQGLLEGLDDSFYTMQVPAISGSWLTKKEMNTIKKMGVYVPTSLDLEIIENPTIPKDVTLSAVASSYFVPRKEDKKDKIFQRFIYALKGARLPENVEAVRGTPYQFGACYEMKHEENGKEMKPRMFWSWCWIVVRPDGTLKIPHEKRPVMCTVTHKRKGHSDRARTSTVFNRQWSIPTMAVAEMGRDQDGYETYLKCSFMKLLQYWTDRQKQWSVGVRKDGHRVTFSIDPKHTSAYFADRETVVNVEGKPKKIIHFVREHERMNGSVVKAHVRGLREFDWKGYHCAVTAPNLNGAIMTNFPIDPIELKRGEKMDGYIETADMAVLLADAEDRGIT